MLRLALDGSRFDGRTRISVTRNGSHGTVVDVVDGTGSDDEVDVEVATGVDEDVEVEVEVGAGIEDEVEVELDVDDVEAAAVDVVVVELEVDEIEVDVEVLVVVEGAVELVVEVEMVVVSVLEVEVEVTAVVVVELVVVLVEVELVVVVVLVVEVELVEVVVLVVNVELVEVVVLVVVGRMVVDVELVVELVVDVVDVVGDVVVVEGGVTPPAMSPASISSATNVPRIVASKTFSVAFWVRAHSRATTDVPAGVLGNAVAARRAWQLVVARGATPPAAAPVPVKTIGGTAPPRMLAALLPLASTTMRRSSGDPPGLTCEFSRTVNVPATKSVLGASTITVLPLLVTTSQNTYSPPPSSSSVPPSTVRSPYTPGGSVVDVSASTVTSFLRSQSGKRFGRSQMAAASRSVTSGGCGRGMAVFCTAEHSCTAPWEMLAKRAAHVDGCSRRTLFAAMTPSCVFSTSGAMGVVMSAPFVSFTPTDPVAKPIGLLTWSLLTASKTYSSGTPGGREMGWATASMLCPSRTAPATSNPPSLIRTLLRDVMQRRARPITFRPRAHRQALSDRRGDGSARTPSPRPRRSGLSDRHPVGAALIPGRGDKLPRGESECRDR